MNQEYNVAFGASGGFWDIRGSSEATKPTDGVPAGSTYYEWDGQHDLWMFDGTDWIKQ